jgi:hypothetical protein
MTPKEKAKELVDKFYYSDKIQAKQCVLIAVDELIEATEIVGTYPIYTPRAKEYWIKVKKEIEKL